jgi:hypothetical protein
MKWPRLTAWPGCRRKILPALLQPCTLQLRGAKVRGGARRGDIEYRPILENIGEYRRISQNIAKYRGDDITKKSGYTGILQNQTEDCH